MADAEAIQKLRDELEELKRTAQTVHNPTITVKVPPEKKLRMYGGKTEHLKNWVEDCKGIVDSMESAEAAQYIIRHLEGAARDEISYQSEDISKDPIKIFDILKMVFGERYDSAQLKKLIYERGQKDKESVQEFARVLSGLVSRLTHIDKTVNGNDVLCEAFCQNVRDKNLRRYLKQAHRETKEIVFFDLRMLAVQWLEDEQPVACSQLEATVSETHIDLLTKQLAQVCTIQEKILQQLSGKQCSHENVSTGTAADAPATGLSSPRQEDRGSKVQCHYCKRFGHYKSGCPYRPRRPKVNVSQSENSTPLLPGAKR